MPRGGWLLTVGSSRKPVPVSVLGCARSSRCVARFVVRHQRRRRESLPMRRVISGEDSFADAKCW